MLPGTQPISAASTLLEIESITSNPGQGTIGSSFTAQFRVSLSSFDKGNLFVSIGPSSMSHPAFGYIGHQCIRYDALASRQYTVSLTVPSPSGAGQSVGYKAWAYFRPNDPSSCPDFRQSLPTEVSRSLNYSVSWNDGTNPSPPPSGPSSSITNLSVQPASPAKIVVNSPLSAQVSVSLVAAEEGNLYILPADAGSSMFDYLYCTKLRIAAAGARSVAGNITIPSSSVAGLKNYTIRALFHPGEAANTFNCPIASRSDRVEKSTDYQIEWKPRTNWQVVDVEVSQVIQNMNDPENDRVYGTVPLIAGKPTAIRVFVENGDDPAIRQNVPASLYLFRDNKLLQVVKPQFTEVSVYDGGIKNANKHKDGLGSLTFVVHGGYIAGTDEFYVQLNPGRQEWETNYDDNRFPQAGTEPLQYHATEPLRISYVNITATVGGKTVTGSAASDQAKFMKQVYPVSPYNISFTEWNGGKFTWNKPLETQRDANDLLVALQQAWNMSDRHDQLYGVYDLEAGKAIIPGSKALFGQAFASWTQPLRDPSGKKVNGQGVVSIGIGGDTVTFAHEIGHNLDLHHPCGDNQSKWPNPKDCGWIFGTKNLGEINDYGIRLGQFPATIVNPKTYDFMSYGLPLWISEYHYRKLLEFFNSGIAHASTSVATSISTAAAQEYFLLSGYVSEDGTGEILPGYRSPTAKLIADPSSDGTHAVRFVDAQGSVLAEHAFTPEYGDTGTYPFSVFVAYPEGTAAIHLVQGMTVQNTLTVSAHAPTVTLVTPNGGEHWDTRPETITWTASDTDGDALTYAVQFSVDGGQTWVAMMTGLTETSYTVDPTQLAGTESGLIRVIATDGVNTTNDQSDAAFSITRKAPMATIFSPEDGATYTAGQPVFFDGQGYDQEDDLLADESLTWRSNRDGVIGHGRAPYTYDLSVGVHTITLEVIDSDGNRSQAWITVNISAEPPAITTPDLSKVENGNLVLMMGPRAQERGILLDEQDESFGVTQLDAAATTFAIRAFGLYEEETIAPGGKIIADGGAGDDQIVLEPGPGLIDFTASAILHGGAGADELSAGSGADTLAGDDGDDRLQGGNGADTLSGGAGSDSIRGGPAADTINGDAGDDSIYGGPAADTIRGDAGNDELWGGDIAPASAEDPDLNDTITGGPGDDTLQGNEGDDLLYGDETLACGDASVLSTPNTDRIAGGPGQDRMLGGSGNDTLLGEDGSDTLCGNSGDDVLDGDDTRSETPDAHDVLYGGLGNDQLFGRGADDDLFGQDGSDTLLGNDGGDMLSGGLGSDTLDGGSGSDYLFGDSGNLRRAASPPAIEFSETIGANDILHGGDDHDVLYGEGGDDQLLGDAGDDRLSGNAGNDHLAGGDGADMLFGNADNDTLLGEQGADRMFGNTGDDTLQGGADDDYLEGNEGADTLSGDDGQDDLIGGSSDSGTPDARDVLSGNQGQDVLAGDNASITRSGSINPADGAVVRAVMLLDPGIGGDDTLSGNEHNDQLYGQVGNDLIHGNEGDDYAEGNDGDDSIYGGADQDDLIGGTSQRDALDGSDSIYGGNSADELSNDFDTIAGDNARISRPVTSTGQWIIDAFSTDTVGMVRRHIILFDVATTTFTPIQGTSSADILDGESGRDILYGQGGDDTLIGGPGDDYIEGNAGSETIHGSAGNDDIIGGTGRINDDGPTGVNGRVDSADELHGDDGFDILAGDNAILVRKVVNGRWLMNTFNSGIQHEPRILLDRDSPNPSQISGDDRLFGDVDDDLLYGQGNDDSASGGAGDDYLEGNAGSDTIHGDEGQDDIIGGTMDVDAYDAGDLLYGDGDSDVILGDNGSISRPLDGSGRWRIDINTGARLRHTVLFNVERINAPQDARLRGPDTMQGGNGPDQLYGQGANDTLSGGVADDVIEGNHGSDMLHGNEGEDDLIGGSSAGNGVIGGGSEPSNLTDTDDEILGDDDDDVMLGDNGVIQRPTSSDGRWQVLRGFGFDLVVRRTTIAQTPEQIGAFGNDSLFGNAGHDDLIGQMGDDYLEGNTGEDALVGDLGSITNRLEDGSRQQVIAPHQPFIDDTIFKKGSLSRLVQLYRFKQGQGADGKDILLGGDGNDSLHGSAGADIIQGDGDSDLGETADEDHLFGGDGDDVLWGGRGHDHVWGGYGNDYLDVKPRPASSDRPADPTSWFTYGMTDNYQGIDYLYGGWGQDALQANIGGPGKTPGDRLLDWVGAYNVYYVCSGAYGEGVITRSHSPSIIQFLQKLAESDGAIATATPNASGFAEVGIVFANESKENANPVHQDHPGHFTCN